MKFRLITKLAAVAVAGGLVLGGSIAYAASFVNVPNAAGQLTGTVYQCVNTARENQIYVELGHPAAGNCAPGYLQYTANQPAPAATATVTATPSPARPEVNTNSESFTVAVPVSAGACIGKVSPADVTDVFCVSLPAGSHLTGVPVVADLNSSAGRPVVTTAVSDDAVTGQVTVTWGANLPLVADQVQVTYDYSA